jgi:ribosomal protein S18 acetylase RimI-like enzyme
MPELTVRQYEPADRERVLELNEKALREVGAYADDPEVVEELRGEGAESFDEDLYDVDGEYLDAGGAFVVGLLDGALVAMGALAREDDATARVTKMRVDPDHQRRGFGQRILDELESRARELGYTELVLDTTARQTAAQGLYEANGYEQFEEAQFGEYDVLLYRKSLDDD